MLPEANSGRTYRECRWRRGEIDWEMVILTIVTVSVLYAIAAWFFR